MPVADSTPEGRRKAKGLCGFLVLFIFSSAAFILSVTSSGYCAFVSRNIVLNQPASVICTRSEEQIQCESFLKNHGVGFWGWQATNGFGQNVCLDYTQPIPGAGFVTPEYGAKFNAAKSFTILASFFGMLGFVTLAVASCCQLVEDRMKCLSVYYFLAFFFQALVFIIMKSNVCSKGFFEVYFPDAEVVPFDSAVENAVPYDNVVDTVTCSLATGSSLAIAAAVLYFCCMFLAPCALPPTPISLPGASD